MIDNDLLLDLFHRYVRFDGEQITNTKAWPDLVGLFVETDARLLSIRNDRAFLEIGRAPWVDALVVIEREDAFTSGEHETDVVLVAHDQTTLHVNDAATVAQLGCRIPVDLDASAFAQLLVRYHPWSVATQNLVVSADYLRAHLGITDGPAVEPLAVGTSDAGLTLRFYSTAEWLSVPGRAGLCDVYRWQATVPDDGRAMWERHVVAKGLPVRKLPGS